MMCENGKITASNQKQTKDLFDRFQISEIWVECIIVVWKLNFLESGRDT